MQPQSPPEDPYGFILNPEKPNKQFPFSSSSMGIKIVFVAVFALLAVVIIIVAGSMTSTSKNAQKDRLIELVQTQAEIVRVSTLANSKVSSPSAQALAVTTKITVQSAQNQTTARVSKYGLKKIDNKLISQGKNIENDKLLAEAEANNRYEETYRKILIEELKNYQTKLKSTFNSSSKSEKVLINSLANSNTLVMQMADPANSSN